MAVCSALERRCHGVGSVKGWRPSCWYSSSSAMACLCLGVSTSLSVLRRSMLPRWAIRASLAFPESLGGLVGGGGGRAVVVVASGTAGTEARVVKTGAAVVATGAAVVSSPGSGALVVAMMAGAAVVMTSAAVVVSTMGASVVVVSTWRGGAAYVEAANRRTPRQNFILSLLCVCCRTC